MIESVHLGTERTLVLEPKGQGGARWEPSRERSTRFWEARDGSSPGNSAKVSNDES